MSESPEEVYRRELEAYLERTTAEKQERLRKIRTAVEERGPRDPSTFATGGQWS